jgi:hypothetical protein
MHEQAQNYPPKLVKNPGGDINTNSLADLLEWFLNYDQKVAQMRHPLVEEIFLWKQADDASSGVEIYPFENAEARFAVGVFQALLQNNSQPLLQLWISDILNALQEAKQTNSEIAQNYKLGEQAISAIEKAEKLPSKLEKKIYLTSCWLEALCTAEARFLGWVYQELYGMPFQPGN